MNRSWLVTLDSNRLDVVGSLDMTVENRPDTKSLDTDRTDRTNVATQLTPRQRAILADCSVEYLGEESGQGVYHLNHPWGATALDTDMASAVRKMEARIIKRQMSKFWQIWYDTRVLVELWLVSNPDSIVPMPTVVSDETGVRVLVSKSIITDESIAALANVGAFLVDDWGSPRNSPDSILDTLVAHGWMYSETDGRGEFVYRFPYGGLSTEMEPAIALSDCEIDYFPKSPRWLAPRVGVILTHTKSGLCAASSARETREENTVSALRLLNELAGYPYSNRLE